jgi:hypothetical protein
MCAVSGKMRVIEGTRTTFSVSAVLSIPVLVSKSRVRSSKPKLLCTHRCAMEVVISKLYKKTLHIDFDEQSTITLRHISNNSRYCVTMHNVEAKAVLQRLETTTNTTTICS